MNLQEEKKEYVGKVVRHFKGNYYYIESVAMDSEDQKAMVIYKPLYHREDSNVWVRPFDMFFEEIDRERPDNITKQKYRFEIVEDMVKDYLK